MKQDKNNYLNLKFVLQHNLHYPGEVKKKGYLPSTYSITDPRGDNQARTWNRWYSMHNTAEKTYNKINKYWTSIPKKNVMELHNNLFTVHTKVFNLIQRNGLILRDRVIRRFISFRVCPESSNLNFSSRNSPCWINYNSQEWFLKLLVEHLGWNINTRQQTSIPDSQHPYPGWEWYHPTTFSNRPA